MSVAIYGNLHKTTPDDIRKMNDLEFAVWMYANYLNHCLKGQYKADLTANVMLTEIDKRFGEKNE